MGSQLNPYVQFKDNAREAMEFYREVFGGDLAVNTFGEYGDPGAPEADLVMHARLETDRGFTLMASDTPPGRTRSDESFITISLSGEDGDELRGYWDKLVDGGEVGMPLERQVWGDEYGDCTDRFGLRWMVNITASNG